MSIADEMVAAAENEARAMQRTKFYLLTLLQRVEERTLSYELAKWRGEIEKEYCEGQMNASTTIAFFIREILAELPPNPDIKE